MSLSYSQMIMTIVPISNIQYHNDDARNTLLDAVYRRKCETATRHPSSSFAPADTRPSSPLYISCQCPLCPVYRMLAKQHIYDNVSTCWQNNTSTITYRRHNKTQQRQCSGSSNDTATTTWHWSDSIVPSIWQWQHNNDYGNNNINQQIKLQLAVPSAMYQ